MWKDPEKENPTKSGRYQVLVRVYNTDNTSESIYSAEAEYSKRNKCWTIKGEPNKNRCVCLWNYK